jgi:hypothetical protein
MQRGTDVAGFSTPMSAHTAPQTDVHVCCAAPPVLHLEWFRDHVRIDAMILERVRNPRDGALRPDRSSPGLALELKKPYAAAHLGF